MKKNNKKPKVKSRDGHILSAIMREANMRQTCVSPNKKAYKRNEKHKKNYKTDF